ncbi:MinD-like ATPase involved in chromosome partitioning or flagellar assembly [Marinactinospora thermotolerans DSM 45154]|uniref:MinD-like ATPase involved in chromosome partitioning or flagellar assembly n=1 Tax=Marinactinospora thermotolerans DSM 45154 TaxID=1122192 RepID=A0A1T4M3C4_9ACTN|nr:MinD/ParA family protein [Marinactinospora thermotolerans]SJZ61376.1 MinD-like ATPase involved in chromosome partitioning or flagellar assembly [Marinactinospora thermotolerans DSM 45154]
MNPSSITAVVQADGTGTLTVDGHSHAVTAPDVDQARTRIIQMVAAHAASAGRPLPITTSDPDGRSWHLLIHPDGRVRPLPPENPTAHTTDPAGPVPLPTPPARREHPARPAPIPPETPDAAKHPVDAAPGELARPLTAMAALAHPAHPASAPPEVPGTMEQPVRPRENSARHAPPPTAAPQEGPANPIPALSGNPDAPLHPAKPSAEAAPPVARTPLRPVSTSAAPLPETAAPDRDSSQAWEEAIAEHNLMLARRIAVISLKGGVGKTTTTVGLGTALAQQHSERVIAVDANHYGTLADRFPTRVRHSMRDLARDRAIESFVALRGYLNSNRQRLHALAGGGGVEDYETAAHHVERFADTVVTDCRTDLDDPVVKAVLDRSTHCVIVLDPSADAVAAGQATLRWLSRGYPTLAASCVIAICRRTSQAPRRSDAERRFVEQGLPVVTIPFDRHLHKGGVIEPNRLRRATRAAYSRLAALITTR